MSEEERLYLGDIGAYAVQSQKKNPDQLVLVFIPPLSSLVARASGDKGADLTDAEVAAITAQADVVAMPAMVADSLVQQRGGAQ